jgi:dephospho-CoA kinase
MDVQVSRADRLRAADVVIDNAGSLDATQAQVDALWGRLGESEASTTVDG